MSKQMRRPVIILIGAVAVGAGALAVYRMRATDEASDARRSATQLLRAQAAEALRVLPMRPLDPSERASELAQTLAGAPTDIQAGFKVGDSDRQEVVRIVAGFVHARFVQPDARSYIAWRTSEGYRFRDRDDVLQAGGEALTVEALTGRLPRADEDLGSLFCAAWEGLRTSGYDQGIPAKVAADDRGWGVSFGWLAANQPKSYPRAKGRLGADVWYAPPSGGYVPWFEPPVTSRALLSSHDRVRAATVGIVFEYRDATRYPFVVHLVQDPATARWWIDAVVVRGFGGHGPPGLY
ncbi:MAG: hypothetical protein KIT68_09580 [Phycisphaeraceae bacterium]|nr:hypothetical protein [Phycisphaeraceae bacterium]